MEHKKGEPPGHLVCHKETEKLVSKDNSESRKKTTSKHGRGHHSPVYESPCLGGEQCQKGSCQVEHEREARRKGHKRRTSRYISGRGQGKRKEKEKYFQNARETQDLNFPKDSTTRRQLPDYKPTTDMKSIAQVFKKGEKRSSVDLTEDLKERCLDLSSKYPNVVVKKHNGRLEIENKARWPLDLLNDAAVTSTVSPDSVLYFQYQNQYDNTREGSEPRGSIDIAHFKPYIKGRKSGNHMAMCGSREPDLAFRPKCESMLDLQQIVEELGHIRSDLLKKVSSGHTDVGGQAKAKKRSCELKEMDVPRHTPNVTNFKMRNYDEELQKNTNQARKRLIEDVKSFILGGKMSPCEPTKNVSDEETSEASNLFLSENSQKLFEKRHSRKCTTIAPNLQRLPFFEPPCEMSARQTEVLRSPDKGEGNQDHLSNKGLHNHKEPVKLRTENLDRLRELIADNGKQTETDDQAPVSDRTRKSQWTCTKWTEKNNYEAPAPYRCPKWTYEMYSDTGLTGMVTADNCGSHIGSKKKSHEQFYTLNPHNTANELDQVENYNVSFKEGSIKQEENQPHGNSGANAVIFDSDYGHDAIMQEPKKSFENHPKIGPKLNERKKSPCLSPNQDPKLFSDCNLRKDKYPSLDTADSGSLQLNCNAAVTHLLWSDRAAKQKPFELEETFVKRTSNVEQTLAKTTSIITDTLRTAFETIMGYGSKEEEEYEQPYDVYISGRQEYEEKYCYDKEYEVEFFNPNIKEHETEFVLGYDADGKVINKGYSPHKKKRRREHMNLKAVKGTAALDAQRKETSKSESSESPISYQFLCDSEPKDQKSPKLKRKGKKPRRAKCSASDYSILDDQDLVPCRKVDKSTRARHKHMVPKSRDEKGDIDTIFLPNATSERDHTILLLSPEDRKRSSKKSFRKHSSSRPVEDDSSSTLFDGNELERKEKKNLKSPSRKKRSKKEKDKNMDLPLALSDRSMSSPPKQNERNQKVAKKTKRRRHSSTKNYIRKSEDELAFESVSSTELSQSILKLYEEIHKLTLQIEASASDSSIYTPAFLPDRDDNRLDCSAPVDREQLITPYFDEPTSRASTQNRSKNRSPEKNSDDTTDNKISSIKEEFGDEKKEPQEASESNSSIYTPPLMPDGSAPADTDKSTLNRSAPVGREQLITPYFDEPTSRSSTQNRSKNRSPEKNNDDTVDKKISNISKIFGDEENEPEEDILDIKQEAEEKNTKGWDEKDEDEYFKVSPKSCPICPLEKTYEIEKNNMFTNPLQFSEKSSSSKKYESFGFESFDIKASSAQCFACYHEGPGATVSQNETIRGGVHQMENPESEGDKYFSEVKPKFRTADTSPPEYHGGLSYNPVVSTFPPEYHPLIISEPQTVNEESSTTPEYYRNNPVTNLSYVKFISPPRFFTTPVQMKRSFENLSGTPSYDDKPCFCCIDDSLGLAEWQGQGQELPEVTALEKSIFQDPSIIFTSGVAPQSPPQSIACEKTYSPESKNFKGILTQQCSGIKDEYLTDHTGESTAALKEHLNVLSNLNTQRRNATLPQKQPKEKDDMRREQNLSSTQKKTGTHIYGIFKTVERLQPRQESESKNDQLSKANRAHFMKQNSNGHNQAATKEKNTALKHHYSVGCSREKSPKSKEKLLQRSSLASGERIANLQQQCEKEIDVTSEHKNIRLSKKDSLNGSSVLQDHMTTFTEPCINNESSHFSKDNKKSVTQHCKMEKDKVSQKASPEVRQHHSEIHNLVSNKSRSSVAQQYSHGYKSYAKGNDAVKLKQQRSDENNQITNNHASKKSKSSVNQQYSHGYQSYATANDAKKLKQQRSEENNKASQERKNESAQQNSSKHNLASHSTKQKDAEGRFAIRGEKNTQLVGQNSKDNNTFSEAEKSKSSQGYSKETIQGFHGLNNSGGTGMKQKNVKESNKVLTAENSKESTPDNSLRVLPKRYMFKSTGPLGDSKIVCKSEAAVPISNNKTLNSNASSSCKSTPSEHNKNSNGYKGSSQIESPSLHYNGSKGKEAAGIASSSTALQGNTNSMSQSETVLGQVERKKESYTSLPTGFAPKPLNGYYEQRGNLKLGKGFPRAQNVSCVWDTEHSLTDIEPFKDRSNEAVLKHRSGTTLHSPSLSPTGNTMNCLRDILFGSARALELDLMSDTKQHTCPPKSRSAHSKKDGDGNGIVKSQGSTSLQQSPDTSDLGEQCNAYISSRTEKSQTSPRPKHPAVNSNGKSEDKHPTSSRSGGQRVLKIDLNLTNGRDKGAGEMHCENQNYDVELWEKEEAKTLSIKGRNLWPKPENTSYSYPYKSWDDDAEIASKLVAHYSDAIKSSRRKNRPDCSPRPPVTHCANFQGRRSIKVDDQESAENVALGLTHQVYKQTRLDKMGLDTVGQTAGFENVDQNLRKSQSFEPTYQPAGNENLMSSFEHLMNLKRPCYVQHCGFRRRQQENLNVNPSSNDNNSSSETSPHSDYERPGGRQQISESRYQQDEEYGSFYKINEESPFKRIAEDSHSFCQEDLSDDEERYGENCEEEEESDEEEENENQNKKEFEDDYRDQRQGGSSVARSEESFLDEKSVDEDEATDDESGDPDDVGANDNVNEKDEANFDETNWHRRADQSWYDYDDVDVQSRGSRNYDVDLDVSEEDAIEDDEEEDEEEEEEDDRNNCSNNVVTVESGEVKTLVSSNQNYSQMPESRFREAL